MDKTFLITVTQDDIRWGDQLDPELCPIAHAIIRTLNAKYVSVGTSRCRWTTDKGSYNASLPDEADNFIITFDRGEDVEPISFELKDIHYAQDQ